MLARMSEAEIEAINAALDANLEEIQPGKAISASWIPGNDWTGTPYMHIYTKACGKDFTASGGCFGKVFPQGGQYDHMIAFVWDDAARTEKHATPIQGLEKLERVAGVIVVSRPSKMQLRLPASPTDGGVAP